MAANRNGVAAGSHDNHDVLNKKSGISDVNIMFESEPRVTERGSPSLVGRGIANPMSERTRGFESHSPRLLVLGSILDKAERTSIINPMTPIQKKDQRQSC